MNLYNRGDHDEGDHDEGVPMDHLSAPPVPKLSDNWIAIHHDSLVRELAAPHPHHLSRRLALTGAGALGTAGACSAAVVLALGGAGASNAFAGWSATPTAPAGEETASALAKCTSQLASPSAENNGTPAMPAERTIPAESWQPVVTDTRGPFTAMILHSGSASATCLSGPSFISTSADTTLSGGGSEHTLSATAGTSATHSGGGSESSEHGNSVSSVSGASVAALSPDSTGPISQASQERLHVDGGQTYTIVQGQVASGVSGVTLTLSDGSTVQATVAIGSFMAWWPGSAGATSAQVAGSSGTTTQQLTFTALAPPATPAGPPAESPSSSSSGPVIRLRERHRPSPHMSPEAYSSSGSESHSTAPEDLRQH